MNRLDPPGSIAIGLLLYPGLTQLDLTGPYEVFSRIPGAEVHLVARTAEPVAADAAGQSRNLSILPTVTFAGCPALDVIMVPGGPGQEALCRDREHLDFIRRQAAHASWVTSVCTGALVLGAAGLLEGYRAVTHWAYLELLPLFGAIVDEQRIVIDRDRITAGGVTAGIDFALALATQLRGEEVAKLIQLGLEYDPAPVFSSGHPRCADPEHVRMLRSLRFDERVRRQRLAIEESRGKS